MTQDYRGRHLESRTQIVHLGIWGHETPYGNWPILYVFMQMHEVKHYGNICRLQTSNWWACHSKSSSIVHRHKRRPTASQVDYRGGDLEGRTQIVHLGIWGHETPYDNGPILYVFMQMHEVKHYGNICRLQTSNWWACHSKSSSIVHRHKRRPTASQVKKHNPQKQEESYAMKSQTA